MKYLLYHSMSFKVIDKLFCCKLLQKYSTSILSGVKNEFSVYIYIMV